MENKLKEEQQPENKIFAVKRGGIWWSVIDCGITANGGFTIGKFWSNHFRRDGRTYRYYAELFNPPELVEWQEIKTLDKYITVVVEAGGNKFEGWKDKEDEGALIFQRFAKLIGKELSLEEIKTLINS